ncbi:uncharacterized protein A4U43_C09F6990 [Asparagus officinalis]|uniref:RING-type domain-containing protein n=1 Tax=Asparagus officinalis TaxID=4686 RepID=A0A5P1E963_ASPOF|nr:uncharacterized protein A4U43_C09F6990 [Asparagus officinalis]
MLIIPNEALQAQCAHLYCKRCLAYLVATTTACPYDDYTVTEASSKEHTYLTQGTETDSSQSILTKLRDCDGDGRGHCYVVTATATGDGEVEIKTTASSVRGHCDGEVEIRRRRGRDQGDGEVEIKGTASSRRGARSVPDEQVKIASTKMDEIGPKIAIQVCCRLGISGNMKMHELTKYQIDQSEQMIDRSRSYKEVEPEKLLSLPVVLV